MSSDLLPPNYFLSSGNRKPEESGSVKENGRQGSGTLQTFLLNNGAPKELARGERHPQRHWAYGSPARGGGKKKKKKEGQGKGNWGAAGMDYGGMPGGAMDYRDPNYSSGDSATSSEEEGSPRGAAGGAGAAQGAKNGLTGATNGSLVVPVASHPIHSSSMPPSVFNSAAETSFRRVDLDALFATSNPPAMKMDAERPASQPDGSKEGNKGKKKKKHAQRSASTAAVQETKSVSAEQYAGGAHHNIPGPRNLPVPSSSLTTTPAKAGSYTNHSTPATPQSTPVRGSRKDVAKLEQSLKEMLNIAAQ